MVTNNFEWPELVAEQEQTDVTHNDALNKIDSAFSEDFVADFTSGDVTLTNEQYRENLTFVATNLTVAGRKLILPTSPGAIARQVTVDNFLGEVVLAVVQGGGNVLVYPGQVLDIYTDGTADGVIAIGEPDGVLSFFEKDNPANAEVIFRHIFDRETVFPIDFAGSELNAGIAETTSPSTVDIRRGDRAGAATVSIGSAIFESAGGDASFGSVQFLAPLDRFEGKRILDASKNNHVLTPTGVLAIDDSQSKFGGSSLRMQNGVAAALEAPDFPGPGAGPFTIDGFVRFVTLGAGLFPAFFGQWNTTGDQRSFVLRRDVTGGDWEFFVSTTGTNSLLRLTGTSTVAVDTWYHIAVDKDGSDNYRMYQDGVVIAGPTLVAETLFDSSAPVGIASQNPLLASQTPDAFFDDVRYTVGVARYAGAFTPRTAAAPIRVDDNRFSVAAAETFAKGEVIEFVGPGTSDATLAQIGVTLATRGRR